MLRKAAYRLGLKFKDSDMESSYQIFKIEIEGKLLNVANFLSIFLNGLNLLLGILGSRKQLVLRSIIFVLSLLGAAIKRKLPQISKAILLITSLAQFYIVLSLFQKMVGSDLPESFYLIGNVFGLMEVIFALSIRNITLRSAFSIVSFVLKMVLLIDGLSNRTLARGIGMSILYIIYYLYYETLERRNFRIIYESREQLKKFQSLLSNDFPTSVIIMSSDFNSILYSNHLFNNTFGADDSQSFILSIFEKFQIESCTPLVEAQAQPKCNLFEFVQTVLPKAISLPEKGVITISAAFSNSQEDKNTPAIFYEIKLRKITWDSKPSYALIFNDISDKQLVTALKIADEQKDRVIATVSHELRTPINGIIGLLEIIGSRVIDEASRIYLDYCKSCSRLLLYLVNSILDLSQIRNNKLQIVCSYFNIDEFLGEVKSLYLFQAQQKNLDFIINKNPDVPNIIYTDKYRLIQILINLLANAFKFTLKGSITLSICRNTEKRDKLVFSVADTGIGIKEEEKVKLFKMYGKLEQKDRNTNANGVGLGLTIIDELVKALNNNQSGNLEVKSEYGKGSEFSFEVPFVKNLLETLDESDGSSDDNPKASCSNEVEYDELYNKNMQNWVQHRLPSFVSRHQITTECREDCSMIMTDSPLVNSEKNKKKELKTVMIVDDNPFNILAGTFVLEKLDCQVTKATSGEECISLLIEGVKAKKRYDLILMDVQMPLMDGLETSKIITTMIKNNELYDLPIVILTANENNEKSIMNYKQCGIVDYLSKPLIESELVRILDKWVRQK